MAVDQGGGGGAWWEREDPEDRAPSSGGWTGWREPPPQASRPAPQQPVRPSVPWAGRPEFNRYQPSRPSPTPAPSPTPSPWARPQQRTPAGPTPWPAAQQPGRPPGLASAKPSVPDPEPWLPVTWRTQPQEEPEAEYWAKPEPKPFYPGMQYQVGEEYDLFGPAVGQAIREEWKDVQATKTGKEVPEEKRLRGVDFEPGGIDFQETFTEGVAGIVASRLEGEGFGQQLKAAWKPWGEELSEVAGVTLNVAEGLLGSLRSVPLIGPAVKWGGGALITGFEAIDVAMEDVVGRTGFNGWLTNEATQQYGDTPEVRRAAKEVSGYLGYTAFSKFIPIMADKIRGEEPPRYDQEFLKRALKRRLAGERLKDLKYGNYAAGAEVRAFIRSKDRLDFNDIERAEEIILADPALAAHHAYLIDSGMSEQEAVMSIADHGVKAEANIAAEFVGQLILDPTNLVSWVSKAITGAEDIQEMRHLRPFLEDWLKPSEMAADDVLKGLVESDGWGGFVLTKRTRSSNIRFFIEQTSKFVKSGATSLEGDDLVEWLALLPRLGDPDLDVARDAARALEEILPQARVLDEPMWMMKAGEEIAPYESKMARVTGRLIGLGFSAENAEGVRKFDPAVLRGLVEQSDSVEELFAGMATHIVHYLEEALPAENLSAIERMNQSALGFFATYLHMGYAPGWAMRNAMQNLTQGLIDGVFPLWNPRAGSVVDYEDLLAFKPLEATRGFASGGPATEFKVAAQDYLEWLKVAEGADPKMGWWKRNVTGGQGLKKWLSSGPMLAFSGKIEEYFGNAAVYKVAKRMVDRYWKLGEAIEEARYGVLRDAIGEAWSRRLLQHVEANPNPAKWGSIVDKLKAEEGYIELYKVLDDDEADLLRSAGLYDVVVRELNDLDASSPADIDAFFDGLVERAYARGDALFSDDMLKDQELMAGWDEAIKRIDSADPELQKLPRPLTEENYTKGRALMAVVEREIDAARNRAAYWAARAGDEYVDDWSRAYVQISRNHMRTSASVREALEETMQQYLAYKAVPVAERTPELDRAIDVAWRRYFAFYDEQWRAHHALTVDTFNTLADEARAVAPDFDPEALKATQRVKDYIIERANEAEKIPEVRPPSRPVELAGFDFPEDKVKSFDDFLREASQTFGFNVADDPAKRQYFHAVHSLSGELGISETVQGYKQRYLKLREMFEEMGAEDFWDFAFRHQAAYPDRAATLGLRGRVGTDMPAGYVRDARGFVDKDYIDPYLAAEEMPMYHVTTARDAVLEQGLKPGGQVRAEGGGGVGLGVGFQPGGDLGLDRVSVTWSDGHAQMIEDRLRLAVRAARGEVSVPETLDLFLRTPGAEHINEPYGLARALGMDQPDDWDDFVIALEEEYDSAYRLVQDLDDAMDTIYDTGEIGPVRVGLTGTEEEMARIDPEQIATVPVAARQNADVVAKPGETELRFKPDDLWVDAPRRGEDPDVQALMNAESAYENPRAIERAWAEQVLYPEIYPEPTKEGYRVIYTATSSDRLDDIQEQGLLVSKAKVQEEGAIWATTGPKDYSERMPLVAFQVPEEDLRPWTELGGLRPRGLVNDNQVMLRQDIPPEDILKVYPMEKMADRDWVRKDRIYEQLMPRFSDEVWEGFSDKPVLDWVYENYGDEMAQWQKRFQAAQENASPYGRLERGLRLADMGAAEEQAGDFYNRVRRVAEMMDDGTPPRAWEIWDANAPQIEEVLDHVRETVKGRWGQTAGGITAEQMGEVEDFLRYARGASTQVRQMAAYMGGKARDFALLNYGDRRYLDRMMAFPFAYPFWYTRTYWNWMQRAVEQPHLIAAYMDVRQHLRAGNQELPEYMREYVKLPGFVSQIFGDDQWINLMAQFVPFYGMFDTFYNPVQARTDVGLGGLGTIESLTGKTAGAWAQEMGGHGPSLNPLIGIFMAINAALDGDVEAAQAWLGHQAGWSRVVGSATAKVHQVTGGKVGRPGGAQPEPWLWAQTENGLRYTGDMWNKRRMGAKAFDLIQDGQMTYKDALLGLYSAGGDEYDKVLQETQQARFWQNLISWGAGYGLKPRSMTDAQIEEMWQARSELIEARDTLTPEEYQDGWENLTNLYPMLQLVMMARASQSERDEMLVWEVYGWQPPGWQKFEDWERLGVKYLMQRFLDDKGDMSEWTEEERQMLMGATLQIAEQDEPPTGEQAGNYQQYEAQLDQMYEDASARFGVDVRGLQGAYYDAEDRDAFLDKNPVLQDFWNWRRDVEDEYRMLARFNRRPRSHWTQQDARSAFYNYYKVAMPPGALEWALKDDLPLLNALRDYDLGASLDELGWTVEQYETAIEQVKSWLWDHQDELYGTSAEWQQARELAGEFYEQRERRFGAGFADLLAQYSEAGYQQREYLKEEHPELEAYWEWKDAWGLANPEWARYYHTDLYEEEIGPLDGGTVPVYPEAGGKRSPIATWGQPADRSGSQVARPESWSDTVQRLNDKELEALFAYWRGNTKEKYLAKLLEAYERFGWGSFEEWTQYLYSMYTRDQLMGG